MSIAPNPFCLGFSTSFANRIAPAHVPNAGFTRTNSFSFSNPFSPSSLRNVLDSPPGITSPSIFSSCSGFLTSTTAAPSSSSRRRCASKSPCSASTPIFSLVDPRCCFAVSNASPQFQLCWMYWSVLTIPKTYYQDLRIVWPISGAQTQNEATASGTAQLASRRNPFFPRLCILCALMFSERVLSRRVVIVKPEEQGLL